MLDFISANQGTLKTDLMTWVGDNSAHNTWDNTAEESLNYTVTITEMWRQTMRDHNIDVFPIQGNHDTWPVNVENFSGPYTNYAINNLKSTW
jgi:sphingomyelin phosphodiesterase